MKFDSNKQELRLNKLLTEWVPVLEDRNMPAVRVRLFINYFLEALLFMAVATVRYVQFALPVTYMQLACLVVRMCLSLVSLKFSRLNIQLLSKLVTLSSVFCIQDVPMFIGAVAFLLQIVASWLFAFSGEQRRGKFDERLNLWVPFLKELLAYACVLLCLSYDNATACYLLLLFTALYLVLSCLDELYNFWLKKLLAGLALLSIVVCGSLALLVQFPEVEPSSLVVVSASAFVVLAVWLLNLRQYSDFKILEFNSNSFAEWEYREYFGKFIYLLEHREVKENDELLRGFYNFHLTRCSTTECPINYSHELDKAERFKQEQPSQHHDFAGKIEYIQQYVCNQMEIASIKFPSLRQLYIFYVSPSIEALRYCHKDNFTEYREWTRIEQCLQDKHIEFTTEKCKTVRDEIKDRMESYLDLSNSLWRLLYDDNVDLRRLEHLGSDILELQQEIREYDKSNYLDNKSMRLLADFRRIILDEAVPQTRPNQDQKKQMAFEEIHTRESPILVISAEPETIQKVESVNAACCHLLGYSKAELLEKNLNAILPDFINTAHVKLLTQRSREILYAKEKNLKTLVYAVTSSGYIVESKLAIVQLNSITGRKWNCTFEPTNNRNCVLLLDDSNVVQGLTASALPLRMNLNTIGREMHRELIEQLEKNPDMPISVGNRLDNLIDEQETGYPPVPQSTMSIRLKDSLLLEDVRIKVVEIEVLAAGEFVLEEREVPLDNEKEFLWFNYPDLYCNVDLQRPVDIQVPEEYHHEFINFGEGINEMRYLNGQVQFKEDRSESSFEKEQTENSVAEIIDFHMKKETYLEALELSKKNLPRPIFELNLIVMLAVLVLTGIAVANFTLFFLATRNHTTNVYVLSQVHLWFDCFYEIASEAIEIAYINSGLWKNTLSSSFGNMTRQLNAIGELSKELTQNQSLLNQFIVGQRFDNRSLYDIIAEFKLHTNTLLNNQTAGFRFAADSPVSLMSALTVNYVLPGFQSISTQLTNTYTNAVQSSLQLYIIFLICFVGLCLPVMLRIYFINRRLNQDKERLLSIFLEVEETTVKRLIDRNNAFKMMVKYDRDLASDENVDNEREEDSEQEEKSARKRIKDLQPVHYFYPFLVFFFILCGIYSFNIYMELTYVRTLNTDFNQLVVFDRSHFSSLELWLYANHLVLYPGSVVQNRADAGPFLISCVSDVYNKQMNLRELYLNNLNAQTISTIFSDFFVDFWVTNGCSYLTYQNCTTDYNGIFKQGADQIWSLVVRKLDLLVSNVLAANTSHGFPANYTSTFAAYQPVSVMRGITTYYYEDVLTVFNRNLVRQTLYQIQRVLTGKIYILAVLLVFVVLSLALYLSVLVRLMRKQTERVEKIVGFVPFRDLAAITQFKKYIRNKYETEIY